MHFASDNSGPAHPRVMQALAEANQGWALPYGNDDITRRAADRLREVLEAPEAHVTFVGTGTAANALVLATQAQPFQTVFCTPEAHIHVDECNAPEFYTGGAKLTLVDSKDALMDPDALVRAIADHIANGVHSPQPAAISITSVTERGTLYDLDHIREVTTVAKAHGLTTHLDGARFSNAVAALGCSPAEMSWKAGIDTLSFGGTKNGLLGVDACVIFDPAKARELDHRRHRGGHNFSKNRFFAAQFDAYLTDNLWLDMARAANAAAQTLARALRDIPGVSFLHDTPANMMFPRFPRATHQRLKAAGAEYNLWDGPLEGDPNEMVAARLVCDWSCRDQDITDFINLVQG